MLNHSLTSKQLFTSNYSRHGQDVNAISISSRPPSYYRGKVQPLLAPEWSDVVNFKYNGGSWVDFTYQYYETLTKRNLNVHSIVDMLPDGAILLCFEPPEDLCHRHVLADLIEHETGLVVPEIALLGKIRAQQNVERLFNF